MNRLRDRSRWFEARLRPGGWLAFMLHRLSGIGLVVYLYLHLAILNQLRQGAQGWDRFVALAKSPFFLFLEAVLLFGVLAHGLNGLRLVLVDTGRGMHWQKSLFWVGLALAMLLTLVGIFFLLGR